MFVKGAPGWNWEAPPYRQKGRFANLLVVTGSMKHVALVSIIGTPVLMPCQIKVLLLIWRWGPGLQMNCNDLSMIWYQDNISSVDRQATWHQLLSNWLPSTTLVMTHHSYDDFSILVGILTLTACLYNPSWWHLSSNSLFNHKHAFFMGMVAN